MSEDSRDAGEANEDSGRGDREFFSAAKPLSTVTAGMVAMVSQHTERESPTENHRE